MTFTQFKKKAPYFLSPYYHDNLDVGDPMKYAIGKTVISVHGLEKGSECVNLVCADGSIIQIAYHPDCCASCSILDMDCEPSDFVNQKILNFEIVESDENPPDKAVPHAPYDYGYQDSFTWSFVKISTTNGHFTMRWYGESNGYYSESPTVSAMGPVEARKILNDEDLVLMDAAQMKGLA